MAEIKLGTQILDYERIPSKNKDIITIRINSNKKVTLLAPTDMDECNLTQIIKRKTPWIIDKLQRIDEIQLIKPREFISGESFLLKGKPLRLKIKQTKPNKKDTIFTDTTTIFCNAYKHKDQVRIKKLLKQWYVLKAKHYVDNRLPRLIKKTGKKPLKVGLRDQLLRWGSCTKNGELLLNWKIIMAPPSVIDYVIIHELTHLHEKNHSTQFWESVKNAMPDYEEKKEWLRINGAKLTFG